MLATYRRPDGSHARELRDIPSYRLKKSSVNISNRSFFISKKAKILFRTAEVESSTTFDP